MSEINDKPLSPDTDDLDTTAPLDHIKANPEPTGEHVAPIAPTGDDADDDNFPCCSYCNRRLEKEPPREKLHSFNWLADIPGGYADSDLVEVTFKNTRKGVYRNSTNLPLKIGDMVAVEATPGHDIGRVTLMGALVERRMRRCGGKRAADDIKRVFRLAKPADIERYEEAKARENDTMIRSRKIAEDLHLNMKIGDVEYQGDGNKAILYYIADERVDFRQLIKVLAETFKVRIEMKQIGARQEAGRIGGIGPCGRPLCCASWMTNFVTVATSAARHQDISLNPQKLAGQCAKLKCCLNFEVNTYVETSKKLPPKDVVLEVAELQYYHFKTDIFKHEITYSTAKNSASNLVTITAQRAFEVIELNKQGIKPETLAVEVKEARPERKDFGDILDDGDISRFDKKKKRKKKKPQSAKQGQQPQQPQQGQQPQQPQQGQQPQQTDEAGAPASDKPRRQKRKPGNRNNGRGGNAPKQEPPSGEAQ